MSFTLQKFSAISTRSSWQILGFETTWKEPAVESLSIHLPNENTPQFRQAAGQRSTTSQLHRYFLRSQQLSHLHYEEYFEQFVLYPYNEDEMLTERDFLEKEQVATSYHDVWTIGGITFNTFHEAACDFSLFENQNEGHLALQEAVQHLRTPAQLCFLVSQILLEGYAAMPLWDEFKNSIAADHILTLGDHIAGYKWTLQMIDDHLSH
ncbi:hypothetical protein CY34DRAFT_107719 [Suillus luteus UH-Slu-Lm8-n1]|uniref:Uncharacterized protein n=1 Tax=Suillus luteus UH-Slu-Lm8-n1 TaxID=930992 RepID=A0A0D0AR94_9AGAM|nr:hypothetical protein CY34DRAFT_107719 [Suillus luteus UH-Slu-Lm8-n1]